MPMTSRTAMSERDRQRAVKELLTHAESGDQELQLEPPVRCPYCKEERQIEIEGYTGFCNVCSKSWSLGDKHHESERRRAGELGAD